MRLHLGQRQVTFEDLWANVIQFGKDAQGPSWQNESIVVVVCLCVCVEGVFLLTGVWEAKGRYSFEKASAENHGPWSGPWGDVWLDHDLLRGPTVPESNDLGANFKRKNYLMQAEQGQTGNAITPGGNNKLHLTEVSSPLDRDKRSQTEQMAHRVINLLLCICCFSESGKSCPAFSCQQQSSTGPYRQERCSFYQSLFPSLLRTNILWPVQPPPILM